MTIQEVNKDCAIAYLGSILGPTEIWADGPCWWDCSLPNAGKNVTGEYSVMFNVITMAIWINPDMPETTAYKLIGYAAMHGISWEY